MQQLTLAKQGEFTQSSFQVENAWTSRSFILKRPLDFSLFSKLTDRMTLVPYLLISNSQCRLMHYRSWTTGLVLDSHLPVCSLFITTLAILSIPTPCLKIQRISVNRNTQPKTRLLKDHNKSYQRSVGQYVDLRDFL